MDIDKILGLCDAGNFKYKYLKVLGWLQIYCSRWCFKYGFIIFLVFQNYGIT